MARRRFGDLKASQGPLNNETEFVDVETLKSLNHNGALSVGAADSLSAAKRKMAKRSPLSAKDEEILRIVGQYLTELGFESTVQQLVCESEIKLEDEVVKRFRRAVLHGHWGKAESIIDQLESLQNDPDTARKMKRIIMEQKFKECLQRNQVHKAIEVLQREIVPLKLDPEKTHQLSLMLMNPNSVHLHALPTATTSSGSSADLMHSINESRKRVLESLQSYMPDSVMLPPRRLNCLLSQALSWQESQCPFHEFSSPLSLNNSSLLHDHICSKRLLPCQPHSIYTDHYDEIWTCEFSPDGQHLAAGSKDGYLLMWDVDMERCLLFNDRKLELLAGIAQISWSRDSRHLLACGTEESSQELNVVDFAGGHVMGRFYAPPLSHQNGDAVNSGGAAARDDFLTCACWLPDGFSFVCGGAKGTIFQVEFPSLMVKRRWGPIRIHAIQARPTRGSILVADVHYRLKELTVDDGIDQPLSVLSAVGTDIIREEAEIMQIRVCQSDRYALINVSGRGVRLVDIEMRCLVRRLHGCVQTHFSIYPCFGGQADDFVACGSEDNRVYIWNVHREYPIAVLTGHGKIVNAVSWNRFCPMIVSAADDCCVRVWTSKQKQLEITDMACQPRPVASGTMFGTETGMLGDAASGSQLSRLDGQALSHTSRSSGASVDGVQRHSHAHANTAGISGISGLVLPVSVAGLSLRSSATTQGSSTATAVTASASLTAAAVSSPTLSLSRNSSISSTSSASGAAAAIAGPSASSAPSAPAASTASAAAAAMSGRAGHSGGGGGGSAGSAGGAGGRSDGVFL